MRPLQTHIYRQVHPTQAHYGEQYFLEKVVSPTRVQSLTCIVAGAEVPVFRKKDT